MLLRAGRDAHARCERLLAPVAGGPHARAALRWLLPLARHTGARLTVLHVQPEGAVEAQSVGRERLMRELARAGLDPADPALEPRVEVTDAVLRTISRVAAEGYDLLVVGASERSRVRNWLFGAIPEQLLDGPEALSVGTIRAARPLEVRLRARMRRWLERRVPQLEREDRVRLFDRLEEGSRGGFDFHFLTAVSTAIAALGLIQDAPAVVIGAMLVAPLMTPMLAAGLALVQGNLVLARRAARSIGNGFLLALLIGWIFGLAVPLPDMTGELLARAEPNLLDLVIALFSGLAAAYAYARPGLMGALAGVAIAAALVPPVASAGVALAYGEARIARGATLLFAANLVAIVLAAAAAFAGLGVRAARRTGRGRVWARRALLALILGALVLSFPLASTLMSRMTTHRDPLHDAVRSELEGAFPAARLVAIERTESGADLHLHIRLRAPRPAPAALVHALAERLRTRTGRAVRVTVQTDLVSEEHLPPLPPPTPPAHLPTTDTPGASR